MNRHKFLKYAGTSAAVIGASALGLNILERGGAFRERGGALRALINAMKAWVIAYHECVAVTSSLPGKESLTATWGSRLLPIHTHEGASTIQSLDFPVK